MLAASLCAATAAAAETPVIVEVNDSSDAVVSPRLIRRLVRLELAELSVPPPVDPAGKDAPLYFRVLPSSNAAIRVELWQVGSHYGARDVSSEGGAQLTARRIALASAELARRLRRYREAERARAEREAKEASAVREADDGHSLRASTTLAAFGRGALVGPSDLWLAGPELRGGLRFSSGARLELGAAGLAGGVPASSAAGGARWLELSLSPGYVAPLSGSLALDVGLDVAAAAVHVTDVVRLDDESGQTDTWSARAGGHLRMEVSMRPGLRLSVGPEIGAVLRPIQGVDENQERLRLGGLWLGIGAGIVLSESGPRNPR